jgi:hypothetical protein
MISVIFLATLIGVAANRIHARPSVERTSPVTTSAHADATPSVEISGTQVPAGEPPTAAPRETQAATSGQLNPSAKYSGATIKGLLGLVRIVPRRPQHPGYDRDCSAGNGCVFGTPWTDNTGAPDGHNGCDTRNDVLREQLSAVAFKPLSNDCDVVAGHFTDPYTGVEMYYQTQGAQIHIDHLIPLAAAWDLGAANWTQALRERFANDTAVELLAVSGGANMSKGDSTPASWLPPNKSYRCEYVVRYLQASIAYELPITQADAGVIEFVARKC